MAIYLWSSLVDGDEIAPFDPASDVLRFDDSTINAFAVAIGSTAFGTRFTYMGKTVQVAIDLRSITTANVTFDNGSVVLVGDNTIGTAADDTPNNLVGGSGNDQLRGLEGDDIMDGGLGNDFLVGAGGDDEFYYEGGHGADGVTPGGGAPVDFGGSDSVNGGSGLDQLFVNIPYQTAGNRSNGNTTFPSRSMALSLAGDAQFISAQDWQVYDTGTRGTVTHRVSMQSIEIFVFRGTTDQPPETIFFPSGASIHYTTDDRLTIADLTGSDLLLITFQSGSGDDVLEAGNTNVRLIALGGTENDTLTGGSGDDELSGEAGDDILRGNAGFDVLAGGIGNDSYHPDADDTLIELPGEGNDNVFTAAARYILPANFDNLTYTGAGSFQGIGNADANVIQGGEGSDYLLGLGGDDTLIGRSGAPNTLQGGLGNDLYIVSANDTVIEYAGEGTDEVRTDRTVFKLAEGGLENLRYFGTADFTGTGNSNDNTITGGSGNDTLAGLAGNNLLNGAGGVNTVDYSSAPSAVSINTVTAGTGSNGYNGTDTYFNIQNFTGSAFNDGIVGTADNNVLRGGAGADYLVGLNGNDTLVGGAGAANQLQGGAGNDVYIVAASGDTVIEFAFEGNDEVRTDLPKLTLRANVENLTYTGAGNFHGIGNDRTNVITGGSGSDYLVGLDGNDTLIGGAGQTNTLQGGVGDDTYVVSVAGDTIVELAGQGVDEVRTVLAAYTLRPQLENLTYTGAGNFRGVGNNADNAIAGGPGSDTLIGLAGNNTLDGKGGIDTLDYSAAPSGVSINTTVDGSASNGYGGTDTFTNIEYFIGTAFADLIAGNGSDNLLQGGAGADYLAGLGGNDTLAGGAGAANQLQGGTGNDTYVVEAAGDSIIEASGEGTDEVITALGAFTLKANIENLTYTGAGNFVGVGNASDNRITAGAGNDTLTGGAGRDTLRGGAGDDILIVDEADFVDDLSGGIHPATLAGGAGTDTLRFSGSGQSLNLPGIPNDIIADIEAIDLTGTGDNSVTLNLHEVMILSSTSNTLRIDGNAGDQVIATDSANWADRPDVVIGAHTYHQYTYELATLLIDTAVSSNL